MMNKNDKKYLSNGDIALFKFELNRLHGIFIPFFLATLGCQLSFFLFFYTVGRLEESDLLLTNFQPILALSTTITLCVLSVFGAIFIRKVIGRLYIGDSRYRIFLFPVKRSKLLRLKIGSFLYLSVSAFFLGLMAALVGELLLSYVLQMGSINIFRQIGCAIVTCLIFTILIFCLLGVSIVMAIRLQSEIATIITVLVSMLLVSNVSAISTIHHPLATFIFCMIFGILVIFFMEQGIRKVDDMDVD